MQTITSAGETLVRPHAQRRGIGFSGWFQRLLLGFMILLVALGAMGATYQAVATARDRRAYPAPGQLVDVGGYKLHIHCMGEGSPTVILDAAGGNSSASWGLVQPELARSTRVCAYDRAGLGWSQRGPTPRDMRQQVRELHALLKGAAIEGPYVLVGHSYGARVARVYAKQHPDVVAGMALIDPGTLDDDPRFPAENRALLASQARMVGVARLLAPFGVVRALLPPAEYGDLPEQQQAASHAFNVTPTFFQTVADQQHAMPLTYAQEHAVISLGSMPLIVMSATTPDDATRRVWTDINGELAALSTNSSHRVIDGATHMGLLYKRDHAQATIDAIRQVVEAVRHGQPLFARSHRGVSNSIVAD